MKRMPDGAMDHRVGPVMTVECGMTMFFFPAMSYPMDTLTPDILLQGYAMGIFPMAESSHDPNLHWIDPKRRGILPLDGFHIPRSLRKTLRRAPYDIRVDTAFTQVMELCAQSIDGRPETWINDRIIDLFSQLHARGYAHSVESWQDGCLVGGLYGLALGQAFFGESMFSRATDASKVALVDLVARLKVGGFTLLDTQFVTEHLMQFGAHEIPRRDYLKRLQSAIRHPARFSTEAVDWEAAVGPST